MISDKEIRSDKKYTGTKNGNGVSIVTPTRTVKFLVKSILGSLVLI